MKRTLKDLKAVYRYITKELTYDTPFAIYSNETGSSLFIGLVVIGLSLTFSTAAMYLGLYLCTQTIPAIFPVFILGLVFTALYALGLMAVGVTLLILTLVSAGYAVHQMIIIPVSVVLWAVGTSRHSPKKD